MMLRYQTKFDLRQLLRAISWREFACLWLRAIIIVGCLAAAEGLLLWHAGFRFQPRDALTDVWVPQNALALNAEGRWAAALVCGRHKDASTGKEIDALMLDLDEGKLTSLNLANSHPRCLALSPRADCLVLACQDKSLIAIEEPTSGGRAPMVLSTIKEHIHRLEFSPSGKFLAGLGDCHTFVWDWPQRRLLWQHSHNGDPRSVLKFSPDSTCLLTSARGGELASRNTANGELKEIYCIGDNCCLDTVWSTVGQNWTFVLQEEHGVSVFNPGSGLKIQVLLNQRVDPSAALAISNSMLAISTAADKRTSLFCCRSGTWLSSLPQEESASLHGLSFVNETRLLSWDQQGRIRQWDLHDKRPEWSLSLWTTLQ